MDARSRPCLRLELGSDAGERGEPPRGTQEPTSPPKVVRPAQRGIIRRAGSGGSRARAAVPPGGGNGRPQKSHRLRPDHSLPRPAPPPPVLDGRGGWTPSDKSQLSHNRPARGSRADGASRCGASGKNGGAERDRTVDLLTASQALSQLSYSPTQYEQREFLPQPRVRVNRGPRAPRLLPGVRGPHGGQPAGSPRTTSSLPRTSSRSGRRHNRAPASHPRS